MPKFADATGREWLPKVTCLTLDLFEREQSASLLDAATQDKITSGRSISMLISLAYFACIDQARENKISREAFAAALKDQAQLTAAVNATAEALALFFQNAAATN